MIDFFRSNFLYTEGRQVLIALCTIGFLGYLLFSPLLYFSFSALAFCFYFFRNPERSCPQSRHDKTIIVSPADGRIIDIQYDKNGGFEGYNYKISIFLSVFDVHVNRIPSDGIIEQTSYRPGTFFPAFEPKSSVFNERNDITIVTHDNRRMLVRQIAGIIARRIVCWTKTNDNVHTSDRYGMIKFGSRIDFLLPASVELYSAKGQRVYGGQTILGRWL